MSDRKYRQSGYQDDDRRPARSTVGPSGPPRDAPTGPRGRGLGMPTATVFRCAVCGTRQSAGEIGFEAVCEKCRADLHTCTHCQHFDSGAPNECRQLVAVRIASKAKRNLCELFTAKAAQEFARETQSTPDLSKPGGARAAFDALFKI